jgi:hypothetical protein
MTIKTLLHAATAFAGSLRMRRQQLGRPSPLKRRLVPELRSRHAAGAVAADGLRR